METDLQEAENMEDLTRDVAERYQLWLESPAYYRDTKEELRA